MIGLGHCIAVGYPRVDWVPGIASEVDTAVDQTQMSLEVAEIASEDDIAVG